MATMYREVTEDYEWNMTEGGTTCRQVYKQDDVNGSISAAQLPVIGQTFAHDPFGVASVDVICVAMRAVYIKLDQHTVKWVAEFSNSGSSGQGTSGARDGLQEIGSMGGRVLGITNPGDSGWTYASGGAKVDQPIFKSMPSGTFTKIFPQPKADGTPHYLTKAEKEAFITGVLPYIGRINDATFCGWPKGTVLWDSMEWRPVYKDATISGKRLYQFELVFAYSVIPGITTDAWQYIMREDGTWAKPLDKDGKELYLYANFAGEALFPDDGPST